MVGIDASGRRATPIETLQQRALRNPDAPVFVAGGDRWGCKRLLDEATGIAEAYRIAGVQPGDRVALHLPNIPEAVVAFCACLIVGAIAVPLGTRSKTAELDAMLARVRPALYLGQVDLKGAVATIADDVLPFRSRFMVGSDGETDGTRSWRELHEFGTGAARDPSTVSFNPALDDPAALLTTSGTTGLPKLAVWTHRTLASFVTGLPEERFRSGDVVPTTTPLMHASGLYEVACALQQDTCLALLPTFDPQATLDLIERERCTVLFGLPSMCAALGRAQLERARNVSSLRLCFVAGDVCPPDVEAVFQSAIGRPLVSLWAATEDGGAALPAAKVGPYTRLKPDTGVRLVDDRGNVTADVGELHVRSPTTSSGYWRDADHLDRPEDGWFRTGDVVRREEDGHLRYMGRTKDLIVRGGSNVSPVEVEEVLRGHPAVADAAVAGVQDPDLGQRVGAAIVFARGTDPRELQSILADARRRLADYKVPEKSVIVEAIPRNALTKVDRAAVARLLNDRGGG